MNILDITSRPVIDDTIISEEYHTYYPYASSSFKTDDEIRIPVQNQDVYTLPSKSYLEISGTFFRDDKRTPFHEHQAAITTGPVADHRPERPADEAAFSMHGITALFSEIRYEINGTVIDQTRNLGITANMKSICSVPKSQIFEQDANGFFCHHILNRHTGKWSVNIPLASLLGFAEDYKKILMNVRQELILIRANTNLNAYKTSVNTAQLRIEKVCWHLPHVKVSDAARAHLLNVLNNDPWLEMGFMKWEMHEYPEVLKTTNHVWSVKSAAKVETPRYIIFGFQTDRNKKFDKHAGEFDHCKLKRFNVSLNGVQYPYNVITTDFAGGHYETAYNMYARFQESYYGRKSEPLYAYQDFKNFALIVVDCSRQNELLKGGTVDLQVEWENEANMPDNTTAYCLILHDRIVRYRPLSSLVQVVQQG